MKQSRSRKPWPWCAEHEGNLRGAEPDLPIGIEDRAADCWEPLLAIADEAGGDWPKQAREAAVYFSSRSADETMTSGVELLAHIKEAFGTESHLATVALLERLRERDESPWKDIRGKPLNDRGLTRRLKGYGIKSKTVRVGDRTPKGYDSGDFYDAWRRYLPLSHPLQNKGNNRHTFDNNNNVVADVAPVAGGMAEADEPDLPEPGSFEPEDDWTQHRFGPRGAA